MMFQIGVGCLMVVATMLCHGLLTGFSIGFLKREYARHGGPATELGAALVVAMFALWLLVVIVVAIVAWALLLLALGVFPDFEESLYFTTVTMTTVGYGDVVVGKAWRSLAGVMAINGCFLFGWSTALVFAVVEATYRLRGMKRRGFEERR